MPIKEYMFVKLKSSTAYVQSKSSSKPREFNWTDVGTQAKLAEELCLDKSTLKLKLYEIAKV